MKEDFLRQFKHYHNTFASLENKLNEIARETTYLKREYRDTLPFKIGDSVRFSEGIGEITGILISYFPQSETSPHDILVEYRVTQDDNWRETLQGPAEDLRLEKIED